MIPASRVTRNVVVLERSSGRRRQVDVLVEIPTGQRTFRVGVEVRDESRPLDLTGVEQRCMKLAKLDVDRGCIVSRTGFTKSARGAAVAEGIERRGGPGNRAAVLVASRKRENTSAAS